MVAQLNLKPRALKIAVIVFEIIFLVWVTAHVAFFSRKLPQYQLSPLAANQTEYSNVLARFSDPSSLGAVKIPVRLQVAEELASAQDEIQIKKLIVSKFWLRPHRIERIEFGATNEVYVVLRPLFAATDNTLFMKKEKTQWVLFTGAAK